MIKKELLDVLACPKCKQPVRESKDEKYIVCDSCKLLYEIREGIPVMLIDEAKQVEDTGGY
ncbi:MAG: Trm112 family protein [Deferribacterales bacterium]